MASGAVGTLTLGSDAAGLATGDAVVDGVDGTLAAANGAAGPVPWWLGSVVVVVAPDSVTAGLIGCVRRPIPVARGRAARDWTSGRVDSGPPGPAAGVEVWVAAWGGYESVVSVVASWAEARSGWMGSRRARTAPLTSRMTATTVPASIRRDRRPGMGESPTSQRPHCFSASTQVFTASPLDDVSASCRVPRALRLMALPPNPL